VQVYGFSGEYARGVTTWNPTINHTLRNIFRPSGSKGKAEFPHQYAREVEKLGWTSGGNYGKTKEGG